MEQRLTRVVVHQQHGGERGGRDEHAGQDRDQLRGVPGAEPPQREPAPADGAPDEIAHEGDQAARQDQQRDQNDGEVHRVARMRSTPPSAPTTPFGSQAATAGASTRPSEASWDGMRMA